MAPSPVMKDLGAAALVGVPKNASFGEGSSVRRPGRLRVVHPDVAEFLRTSPRLWRPRRPTPPSSPRAAAGNGNGDDEEEGARARYDCAFEDEQEKAGFAPPRLVWGKVKSHPWWPGQVFDPADASELAQRQQRRRGSVLVAYFWDKSFAWTDAAALRPFRAGFRRFAAQSAHSTFAASVDAALDEVARRVDVGLSCCCCCGGKNMAVSKKQVIDNAGVRDGAYGAAVDAAFARRAFRGEAFVGYVSALAAAPLAGADRVDLAIATAQLKAFSRWRGSRGLPEYTYFHGIDGVAAMEAAPARAEKRKSRSGGDASGRGKMSRLGASWKNAACESMDDDTLELVDLEASPQPTPSQQTPTRMGMLMSRAAQQMSRSPVVLRANGNAPEVVSHMAKCTSAVDELPQPQVNNGALNLKDAHTCNVPLVNEQAGIVLNFSSAGAVPSTTELTMIFSRFGPIKEASAENSAALVIFKKRAHAEEAFARTAKIRAISGSLVNFRLTYSVPPATMDSPESERDPQPVEPVMERRGSSAEVFVHPTSKF
ncbi:hypothetical protein EJB05_34185, partial [Eragrostis curvula]